MSVYFVYITCKDKEEARAIASAVIERKLAACANILPAHEALYFWDGAVRNETETAMILKTSKACYPALERAVKDIHSYDEPCIVALPVEAGSQDFLNWIERQTAPC